MKLAIYITAAVVVIALLSWLLAIAARNASDESEHSNMDRDCDP